MEDTDDIFSDFEDKVKGKKERRETEAKRPQEREREENADQKEILKERYRAEKEALEEKYRKEMEVVREKEITEAIKQGKINPSLHKVERIIYISVILILLGYLIYNIGFSGEEKAGSEQAAVKEVAPVKEENKTAEANKTEEKKAEVKEAPKEEPKEEQKYSGSITLTIDRIYSEKKTNATGQITQIDFTIDNGKNKVLTPVVNAYIYDDDTKELWETVSRGAYTYPIGMKAGAKQKGSITITPKTFSKLDLKKSIRVALNDTKDGFITAANDAILIS